MNKIRQILLGIFLLIIPVFASANSISDSELNSQTSAGNILSDSFSSLSLCTTTKDKYNNEFSSYKRSDCFSYNGDFYYFICQSNNTCSINVNTNSTTTNNNTNTQSNNTNVPNKAKLDVAMKKIAAMEKEFNNHAKYIAFLEAFEKELKKLGTKYAGNDTIKQMIGYLGVETQKLKSISSMNSKNNDIDNFFCDLLKNCDDVNTNNTDTNNNNTNTNTKTNIKSSTNTGCVAQTINGYTLPARVNGGVSVLTKTVSNNTYEQEFKCNSGTWETRGTEVLKTAVNTNPTTTSSNDTTVKATCSFGTRSNVNEGNTSTNKTKNECLTFCENNYNGNYNDIYRPGIDTTYCVFGGVNIKIYPITGSANTTVQTSTTGTCQLFYSNGASVFPTSNNSMTKTECLSYCDSNPLGLARSRCEWNSENIKNYISSTSSSSSSSTSSSSSGGANTNIINQTSSNDTSIKGRCAFGPQGNSGNTTSNKTRNECLQFCDNNYTNNYNEIYRPGIDTTYCVFIGTDTKIIKTYPITGSANTTVQTSTTGTCQLFYSNGASVSPTSNNSMSKTECLSYCDSNPLGLARSRCEWNSENIKNYISSSNISTNNTIKATATGAPLICTDKSIVSSWYKEKGRCPEQAGIDYWNGQIKILGAEKTKEHFIYAYDEDIKKNSNGLDGILCPSGYTYVRNTDYCVKK